MCKPLLLSLACVFLCSGIFGQDANYASGTYSIAITEFNYNSDKFNNSGDWVELHNYGGSAIDLSGWNVRDNLGSSYTIPNSTLLAPDAYLVVVEYVDTFLMVHPSVTNYVGNMAFGFNNLSGSIRLFDNVGGLVKQINYLDSVPWPKGSDGYGPTVQILDELAAENDGTNWISGCVLGTPGSDYVPCDYDIVVSEINYNSLPAYNPGDWIELYNRGSGALDIGGWTLRDSRNGNAFVIPAGTNLAPGARLVITDSLSSFTDKFPGVDNVIGEPMFSFSNGGDAIRLYAGGDKIRYSVRYNDNAPWPLDPDGTGFTLELIDEGGNPNIATSWVAGCLYGSPGTPYIFPCPDAVVNFDPGTITVGPVPFADQLYIGLQDNTIMRSLTVTDLLGKVVFKVDPSSAVYLWHAGYGDGYQVSPGMYLITIVNDAGAVATKQVVKM